MPLLENLVELDLSYNFLSNSAMMALAKVLKSAHRLQYLRLSKVGIDELALYSFLKISKGSRNLLHLDLSRNDFSHYSTSKGKTLLKFINNNRTLVSLNF